jgi:alkylhydroperoxidase family enzyme
LLEQPRIRPRSPDEVTDEARGIFDGFLRERGNIPNMFRTVAVRPEHLTTLIAHFRTVMNEGAVPPLLKELIAVRVSSINRCRY